MRYLVIAVLALGACGDDGGQVIPDAACPGSLRTTCIPIDAAVDAAPPDAGDAGASDAAAPDDALPGDATATDGALPPDAAPAPDAALPPDAAPAPDAATELAEHVHIYIDNFCNVSVAPQSYTVDAGQTLQLSYHNHSVDYAADVWLSYGGGFLDLPTGATWDDQFTFCSGPSAYTAYADISIAGGPSQACPGFRLYIHCQ